MLNAMDRFLLPNHSWIYARQFQIIALTRQRSRRHHFMALLAKPVHKSCTVRIPRISRFGHAPCSVDQICAIWNLIVVKMPRTTNSKSTASWVNRKGGSDCFGASALSVGSFWKA